MCSPLSYHIYTIRHPLFRSRIVIEFFKKSWQVNANGLNLPELLNLQVWCNFLTWLVEVLGRFFGQYTERPNIDNYFLYFVIEIVEPVSSGCGTSMVLGSWIYVMELHVLLFEIEWFVNVWLLIECVNRMYQCIQNNI